MGSTSLDTFLEMMAVERGASPHTLAAYRRDLEDATAALDQPLDQADGEALGLYLRSLASRGLSARTQARRLAALRQFFKFLVLERRRADDPTSVLATPRLGRVLPKTLSPDAIAALLTAAAALPAPEGPRLVCMIEVMYAAGLRVSELATLPVATVKRDTGTITVRGKGDKERVVPLTPAARRALVAWLQVRAGQPGNRSPHLFPTATGDPIDRRHIYEDLKRLALTAGLDPATVSPHVLRHAVATHLLSNGADLRVVQDLLGHQSIATTELYTHVATPQLQSLVQRKHPLARRG
ncbi:MAG: tyrosine recombinase [Alphaproteobacteria bacterium]|nr:tyrosine recombinase [Alphaproteobacteria bacterium]